MLLLWLSFNLFAIIAMIPVLDKEPQACYPSSSVTLASVRERPEATDIEDTVLPLKHYLLLLSCAFFIHGGFILAMFKRHKAKFKEKNNRNYLSSRLSSFWIFIKQTRVESPKPDDADFNESTAVTEPQPSSSETTASDINEDDSFWDMMPDCSSSGMMWYEEVERAEEEGILDQDAADCPEWARIDLISQTIRHSVDFPPPLFHTLDLYQTLPTIYEKD